MGILRHREIKYPTRKWWSWDLNSELPLKAAFKAFEGAKEGRTGLWGKCNNGSQADWLGFKARSSVCYGNDTRDGGSEEAGRKLVRGLQWFLCENFPGISPKPISLQDLAQSWHISGIKKNGHSFRIHRKTSESIYNQLLITVNSGEWDYEKREAGGFTHYSRTSVLFLNTFCHGKFQIYTKVERIK